MKNDLLIVIHKELGYARKAQQGQKTEFLNCIDNIQEFCRHIKLRINWLNQIFDRSNGGIDITVPSIPHGVKFGVPVYKSIIDALYDVEEKIKLMRIKKYNQLFVNFTLGEIAMMNAVVDIVNNWLKDNDYDQYVPRIIVKRHYDDSRKPEYIDISAGKRNTYPYGDSIYEKLEQRQNEFELWDCTLPLADPTRHRT